MTTTSSEVSFVLPVDKPVGPTSHDVVSRARRALKNKRIGHTGTLDPFASGLLLLCVGNATRLAEYLTGMPKTYEAEMMLGAATDTDDHTGTVYGTTDAWRSIGTDALNAAFARWTGDVLQTPTQYSAKKIDGERAYDVARRGDVADVKPVAVTIHSLVISDVSMPLVKFTVTCSSGTYVRALARDIGSDLGVYGHLTALRRTHVGPHDVTGALGVDRLDDPSAVASHALTSLDAIAGMPRVSIDDAGVKEISHGRIVRTSEADAHVSDGDIVALVHDADLIAIARRDGGVLRPKKVFLNA